MPAETFFARQARKLMRRATVKPAKLCLENTRLEDRAMPSISGTAFIDFNANGARDLTTSTANTGGAVKSTPGTVNAAVDVGIAGLLVRVFDSSGAQVGATATTGTNGGWTNAATVAGQTYRVEFTGLPAGYTPGPHGVNNGTATQFRTDGTTTADFGITRGTDYFNNNPLLVTPQYRYGPQNLATATILSFPYNGGNADILANSAQANNPTTHDLAVRADNVGTTWGIAFNRQQSTIYASSFTKRHSGWAPNTVADPNNGGPGFIYRMNVPVAGGPVVDTATTWINLDGLLAMVNGAPTTIDTVPAAYQAWADGRNANVPNANWNWEMDAAVGATDAEVNIGWDAIGKTGLGGLATSDDGQFVYVMNLGDRRLYKIAVNADGTANTTTIEGFDMPVVDGVADQATVRPFAVEFHNGLVYIGLVNSAQGGSAAALRGYVYSFDPVTETYSANSLATDGTTFNGSTNGFRLDYERGTSYGGQDEFNPWAPVFTTQPTGGGDGLTINSPLSMKFPQAMLSGISFDNNNNLVVNLRDRLGDQGGNSIPGRPGSGLIYEALSSGDTLVAFANTIGGSSGWTLERNGSSPVAANPATGFSGSVTLAGVGTVTYGPNDGQGPPANPALPGTGKAGANPNGEYIGAEFFAFGTHTETGLGASVHVPGFPDFVNTNFDPQPINGEVRSGGTRWFHTTTYDPATGLTATSDGNFVKSYQLYFNDQGGRGVLGATFGKANGLGDLIAVATEPPPIEIGNRIFNDTDRDGIQDAGEAGIGGVTVELWAPGGLTAIASVVSAADGTYFFNSGIDPDAKVNPGNEKYLAAIAAGKAYEVRIPTNPVGLTGTKANNVANPAYAGDADQDSRDSDLVSGVISVAPLPYGGSNHTYDAGFAPGLSLGNFVWEDANNDGTFNAGEAPLAGIPVNLYKDADLNGLPDGAAIASKVTDGNGNYLFDSLDPGSYVVEITSQPGFRSSTGTGVVFDVNGAFENGLVGKANSTTNEVDHGVTFNGSIDTGFVIRTVTVTLANPGDPANPDTVIAGVSDGTANLRQDFGLYRAYSLGNRIFNDNNNDGLFNGADAGIDGVTVRLFDLAAFDPITKALLPGATALVGTASTAGGGFYRFDDLIAGQYVVVVTGRTGPLANFVSSTGGTSKTTTFEPPLVAQPAAPELDNQDGGSTDGANFVRTGTITLGPGASEPTTETGLVAGLNPQGTINAQADMTNDFGFYQPLSLGNQIFNDANNDGQLNGAEVGIDGVSVSIFRADAGGNIVGGALETQTTKSGGYYLFTGLGTDSYVVRVDPASLPAGFQSSSGKNGFASGPFEPGANPNTDLRDNIDRGTVTGAFVQNAAISISPGNAPLGPPATPGFTDTALAGDSYRIVDFGFFSPLSLGSLVWNDQDNSGTLNGVEAGIDGLTVNVYSDGNGSGTFEPAFDPLVNTTTTKSGGLYLFTNLAAGGYFVEVAAAGFKSSTGAPGQATGPYEPGITGTTLADDNQDHGSNAGAVIRSGVISLQPGGNPNIAPIFGDTTVAGNRNYTVDFGLFSSLSLGDFVWNDSNNDGKFTPGETGISGVAVDLLVGGLVVKSTTTDGGGKYLFSDLSAGTYSVRITAPVGFISSTGKNGFATGDYEPVTVLVGDNEDHGSTVGGFVVAAPVVLTTASNLQQDFGLFQPLSLGDQVWIDANNDGIFSGETGLAGVAVTLLDATGKVTIANTTTDANGVYGFSNLVQGTYVVNIAPGSGYVSSTGTNGSPTGTYEPATAITANSQDHGTQFDATNIRSTAVLGAPGTNTELNGLANLRQDFGVFQPLSLGDFVFNDLDNDGIFNKADTAIKGVAVALLDGTGTPIGSATTDANGLYGFTNLIPGNYTVRVTPPAGFATSTGTNGKATGAFEPGATPTVNNQDTGSANGAVVDSKVTLFAPGNAGNPGAGGLSNLFVDFGLFQPLSLGSLVWIDTDNNGVFDTGETKLGNIPVSLFDSTNALIGSTTTDANGSYIFLNLIPGSYFVSITPPAGVLPSTKSVGPLTSPDNQNVGTVGPNGTVISPTVTLALGGAPIVSGNGANQYVTFDFGLLANANLSGFVYFDPNIDGNFTPGVNGDSPFGGVTVRLTSADPNFVPLTTTTDKTGFYQFTGLAPGTYTVTETQPAGHYFDGLDTPGSIPGSTTPSNDVIVVPLGSVDSVNNNFGEIPPAFVHGYVWIDTNNNCQFDNGRERGLGNVPVTISGTTFPGSPLQGTLTPITILTDASGYYAFPVLPPGTYAISRGDLPVEVRNIYANSCLQNGDPNPNPPTPAPQQFQNVILGTPVRGPFNFGVVPINPNDPTKRNFLGSSPNTPTTPNPNLQLVVGGPTRGPAALNAAFTTTTGVPTGNALVLVGTGVGQRAVVRVFDYAVGNEKYRFEPYGAYTGGVRVAQGDVDGDGVQDIVTATGQGGGPRIRVFSGATGSAIKDFFAYESDFRGGVFVAAADIDGDGRAEIVTGTELGGGPRVRVFNGLTNAVMQDFFAFSSDQRGGVRVAAGDFDGDNKADIVTTTGASVPTRVRIFNGQNLAVLQDYTPFGASFSGGANLGLGDINGDGQLDVLIGTEAGGGPRVQIFNGKDSTILKDFFAFDSSLRSGVRVAARDINGDGVAEIVVTAGNTGAARVRMLRATDFTAIEDFFALDPEFRGGAYVG